MFMATLIRGFRIDCKWETAISSLSYILSLIFVFCFLFLFFSNQQFYRFVHMMSWRSTFEARKEELLAEHEKLFGVVDREAWIQVSFILSIILLKF